MKKLLILSLVSFSTVAFAQTLPTEYNLKLAPNQLDLVGKAIGKLPYEDAAPLLQVLQSQIVQQQAATKKANEKIAEPVKEDKPKEEPK